MRDESIRRRVIQFRNKLSNRHPGPEIISRLVDRLREREGIWFHTHRNYWETVVDKEGETNTRYFLSLIVKDPKNPYLTNDLVTVTFYFPRYFIVEIWNESRSRFFDIAPKWQRPVENIEGIYQDIILPRMVESMENHFKYVETKLRTIPYHWKEIEATEIIKEFIHDEKKKNSGANI